MSTKPLPSAAPLDPVALRQAIHLLRSQAASGRIDPTFLSRQLDKLGALVDAYEEQQRQATRQQRAESLYAVSRLLGSSLDLQIVLDHVIDAIIELTGAERAFLMLRDDDGAVAVKAARNLDQQTLTSDQFKYSRGVVNQVLDTGEAILTTNATEDPRFNTQASIVNQLLRSISAVPLRVRGQVIGVIYADARIARPGLDEGMLEMLEAFAAQAAIAIDNARLFSTTDQQLAARVNELQQLRRVDLQLSATLHARETAQIALDAAARMAEAEIGHLGMVEDGHVPALVHYGLPAEDTQPLFLDRSYPQVQEALDNCRSLVIQNDRSSLLLAPIVREQRSIGILVLRRAGHFSDEQCERVDRLTARAAIAIENARLVAALKAADLAKSEFVGVVAHDLKVPMTSILGYADLTLLDGGLTNDQNTYLEHIRETVFRMEKMVSDLADISRIESGHFLMEPKRVTVAEVVQALHAAISTQMAARGHRWVEQIVPDLPPMQVDYYRLLQVLTNLTSNAYKYTPPGGTITLTVEPDSERARHVRFTVSDTGIGLSPEAIRKLGTKFWRAEDEFTRAQPGAGLGFAITRRLVEQMGSTILIRSAPGRGSSFSFSIPTEETAS